MSKNIFKVATYNREINKYLPFDIEHECIYESVGLIKHIQKRHPECVPYLPYIASIINEPDYVGINPNEADKSFELVKKFGENVQIGIKLDIQNDYWFVATLHTITNGKLQHGIENGRLQKFK